TADDLTVGLDLGDVSARTGEQQWELAAQGRIDVDGSVAGWRAETLTARLDVAIASEGERLTVSTPGDTAVLATAAALATDGVRMTELHAQIQPLGELLVFERDGAVTRAAATLRDDGPRTLARFLRAGVTFGPMARFAEPDAAQRPVPSSAPAAAPARPAPSRAPSVAPEVPHGDAEIHQTRAVPTFSRDELSSFTPLAPPPAPSPPASGPPPVGRAANQAPGLDSAAAGEAAGGRPLSLKRVMQFILDRAPDLNAGQLDIYRVFIRVNTKLLRRNGINTLRFEEDRLITDDELQRAITASVEKTLGLPCPQEVFLAA
ncbi:MAG: hypothetical protein AAFY88_14235, partial [Acidobacteriota bacterium]